MSIFRHNNPQYKIKILDFTYTSEPSINSALPLKLSKIKFALFVLGCIFTLGFLWLLAKWSSRKKAIMLYNVSELNDATAFLIQQQDVAGAFIVSRKNKFDVKRRENVVSFSYHDRNFLYHEQKDVFLPIRYEDLGIQLDRLQKGYYQPYSKRSRKRLLSYYGLNQIQLTVQNYFQVFIEEMLTPYEVFQLYAIILWISQRYYTFSIILLVYSFYSYWLTSKEVIKNQKKLAESSVFSSTCKILSKQRVSFNQEEHKNNSQQFTIIQQIKSFTDENNQKKQLNLLVQQIIPKDMDIQKQVQVNTHQKLKHESERKPKVQVQSIDGRNIIPGDVIILKQGDTVPCDCVLISGQVIVDESYLTGENYLNRKVQLDNFEYTKDREKVFLLCLGTKIIKVKSPSNSKKIEKGEYYNQTSEKMLQQILQPKQIACLVTQTNYNTQRGKYLRAIRYQRKPIDNFTMQSIYFIYIIIFISIIAFLIIFPILKEGRSNFAMFLLFLDLLAMSIPITLPTALSVGINFAQHRLSKIGIHSILPSNILLGGSATTIVLDSNKVLSKNYEVASIVVGVKNNSIGNTYSNLEQFMDLTTKVTFTQSYYQDPKKKKEQMKNMTMLGKMLLRSFSTCHSLERYNNQLSGSAEEKNLFDFVDAKYIDQDKIQCLSQELKILQRIYFKEKDRKFAVVVEIKTIQSFSQKNLEARSELIQQVQHRKAQQFGSEWEHNFNQRVIFIKGPPQSIIQICKEGSYPKNYQDYIVDVSQKGFKTLCFAYKITSHYSNSSKNVQLLKEDFIFCGFALLQAEKKQDIVQTIKQLKQAKMQIVLISSQKHLQSSSLAISNQICSKNDLILCDLKNGHVKCTGHIEWQSDGTGSDLINFIEQFDSSFKHSNIGISSNLYEQLFMKRDDKNTEQLFNKILIYSQMENRHTRNVYFQFDKKKNITFAVGSGANVSQCANLSIQLERAQCSLLSSFHTSEKSLKCITNCLIICRAALATNFHCFSMMILFSMVQFTTVVILYYYKQQLSNSQMLYQDLFVTFPIFITINMTLPVDRLSKELPPQSFFSGRAIASMAGQFIIQFITQIIFIYYVVTLRYPNMPVLQNTINLTFEQNYLSLSAFILSNYLYLGIVLSTSVSKPFRKPFYTNIFYTGTLVLLWFFNTAIVLFPQIIPKLIRPDNLSPEIQEILIIGMLLGNLIMIVMYFYENCLVWIGSFIEKIRHHQQRNQSIQMRMN